MVLIKAVLVTMDGDEFKLQAVGSVNKYLPVVQFL